MQILFSLVPFGYYAQHAKNPDLSDDMIFAGYLFDMLAKARGKSPMETEIQILSVERHREDHFYGIKYKVKSRPIWGALICPPKEMQ